MTQYACLLLPAANKVYNSVAAELSLAELGVFNEHLFAGRLQDLQETRLCGARYLRFVAQPLDERDLVYLAYLSSLYVLVELRDDGLLRPLTLPSPERFDDDLLTIPKYQGKTNEMFTKLLMNVTVASGAFAHLMPERKLFILDPLAGRGTTLNQALMYGWHSAGIEIDPRDNDLYEQYLSTYLERKRLKHRISTAALRDDKSVVGRRMDVEIGLSKAEYAKGETIRLTHIHADSTAPRRLFKAETFHAIVTDLPYGVVHGSRNPAGHLTRRPLDLLEAGLTVWSPLLKRGGTLGLSWNRHVAGREKVVGLVGRAGLTVLDSAPYRSFSHAVDQAITRDVLVARKA